MSAIKDMFYEIKTYWKIERSMRMAFAYDHHKKVQDKMAQAIHYLLEYALNRRKEQKMSSWDWFLAFRLYAVTRSIDEWKYYPRPMGDLYTEDLKQAFVELMEFLSPLADTITSSVLSWKYCIEHTSGSEQESCRKLMGEALMKTNL